MPRFRPRSDFADLGARFADPVRPAAFPAHTLRYANVRWAGEVGLDTLSEDGWINHFGRFETLPGAQAAPLAMRYHGHQFQHYNRDLGDGRGFLFAQAEDRAGRLLDFGTKGSGQTPYSRAGDGRLTLKGGVREVLAANLLEALGVYTSKPFCLIETGEALQRNDEPSPTRSAVLTRLSHSHIRFGTFQRHAFHEDREALTALVDHVITAYYPALETEARATRPAALLGEITKASASLAASWMTAGFVHGVLNTDNVNVTGESFDYGPYRFLPYADPDFTAAYFDQSGLYRFGAQPGIMLWNLRQLAGTLTLLCETEPLIDALSRFEAHYQTALARRMFARLGLLPSGDLAGDLELSQKVFQWLTTSRASWPDFFFDVFCGRLSARKSPNEQAYQSPDFKTLLAALSAHKADRPERLAHAYFTSNRPVGLVIGEIEAIWSAIDAHDDWGPFEAALDQIESARQGLGLTPSPVP
jgi:serine/tyrosine/threonine adenylyltransferase